jgi:UDP-N-acetylmuramoyl-tripeptide--D-alanyl-D-alanine ligase
MIYDIIFWIAYIALWAAVVRYDVHMFQHNSYRVERYARWYRGGCNIFRPIVIAAFVIIMPFLKEWMTVATAVMMFSLAWDEFRTTYKKPLVYTMRVWRLIATAALLTVATIVAALYFVPAYTPEIALGILVLPVVMLLANLVNKPLEAAISRWYYNDAKRILRSMPDLKIIGVTGSFGKTSRKHYLYRILSEKYNVLMTPGNFNTTLGVVRTVREHLKPHHEVFIVEMGAKQRGDIKEICDLVEPQMGIVTSVGEMHLETFGTIEGVAQTKFELIDALPAGGVGVVNIDSEAARRYMEQNNYNVVTYGIESKTADYRAVDVVYSEVETRFAVEHNGIKDDNYVTHILGRGNILNITAALAVAEAMGVGVEARRRAVKQIEQVEHRLSMRRQGGITILDDAYNSNPTGAKMALEVLAGFTTEGARYVVTPGFVEMGAKQYENNKAFGVDIAMSHADRVYVVNEVNREAICEGLREGGYPEERVATVASFSEAMADLQPRLKIGDVVLYENDLPDSFK